MISEEDPYQTDEDEEYVPSELSTEDTDSSSSDCQNLLENNKNMLNVTNTDSTRESFPSETRIHITPTRTKKRVKHVSEWANAKRKLLRTQGKEYVSNGKIHQAKTLKVYNHVCRYKCNENIPETKRRELFKEFYKLSSYDHQTAFLSSCVKKMEIKRKKGIIHNKNYSTCITLLNTRVCKEFFLKTFDISNKRFTFVCKKTNHLGMAQPDKRGKGKNHRKMNEENRTFVITHIKMFPRYKSHYSRKSNSETKYLSSNLNIKKMYELYKQECVEQSKNPVKESYYRFIFNTEFNLRFHQPHSDTCSKCDAWNNLIQHSLDKSKVEESKVQLAIHQSKAERAINAKKHDIVANSNNPDTVVVCFDLQQTLPTPLLTTSKVFYLRQLWTYNFCVYNLVTGKAHMYVWSEDVASRGSQEIGSCLLDFIKSLPAHVKKLIAYSDSCGGQNKNKNICKLFMFLVKSTPLEEIHHKFLEPGHTYMECDRAFGLIEKRKKLIPQVFVPNDWCSVIQSASKKFEIHVMDRKNFFSFSSLNTLIKDPKKDVDNKNLKFRDISYFKYTKTSNFYCFEYKLFTLQDDFPFTKCQCALLFGGRPPSNINKIFCSLLNTEAIKITLEKWNNLQSLLEYIPPKHHTFYKELSHEKKRKNAKTQMKTNPVASTSKNVAVINTEDDNELELLECDMDDSTLIDSDYE